MDDNHLKHGFSSGEPVPHHHLHEGLAFHLQLVVLEHILHAFALSGGELAQKLLRLFLLEFLDGVEDHEDGVENIYAERSLVVLSLGLGPLLGLEVEGVLSPQFGHHFVNVDAQLGGVHF